MSDWYRKELSDLLEDFSVNPKEGLSDQEAAQRLEKYGRNELQEGGIKSPWEILWEQMTEVMVVILVIAAVISILLQEWTDAIVILAIVILNAVLGVSQEYRAEQAIAALKRMAVPTVRVRRGSHIKDVSAPQLVPGDIVMVESGSLIPADGILVENANLSVEEAALTGESEPVVKKIGVPADTDLPLGDRLNAVFMGTTVTYGRGEILVTDTGMSTELGNIANLLQSVDREPTPLQQRLARLGTTLAWVALGIIIVVFALGLIRSEEIATIFSEEGLSFGERLAEVFAGEDIRELFLTSIALAVAAIPEGLPAVVTIALALGSQRMLRRNALIRKLPAVETLGSVTVICSDKTGTLTENRMTVTVLDVKDRRTTVETLMEDRVPILDADRNQSLERPERTLSLMLKGMALCNDALLEPDENGNMRAVGDPTEGALVVAAAQLGLMKSDLEERWPRVAEIPFSSARKRMATVQEVNVSPDDTDAPWRTANYVVFVKGAIDGLLDICNRVWDGDDEVPLDEPMLERILEANQKKASSGQRVLGLAFKSMNELPGEITQETIESDLTFIGMVGMLDPARPEVKTAVAECKTAGIRPVMITGDHPLTAKHIAEELAIAEPEDKVVTGKQLLTMDDKALSDLVEDVPVFARVAPEHKLNIVSSLQDLGHVVAMTGDGVNDAPALKRADIGVAMGITGTDVSKEASDMVLLDDNFATIVAAVHEGRVIYDNIRKFIKYTLSSNTGELFVMLVAPFLGMPLPLLPLQILWINLVTDGLPGLALAVEQAERGTMKRSPFAPDESVFSRGIGRQIITVGVLMGLVSLIPGFFAWRADIESWRTIIFTTLTLSQMGNALGIRSNQDSVFAIGLFSNSYMVIAIVTTFLLQLGLIYVPFLQNIFGTSALTFGELALSLLLSTIVFIFLEIEKWYRRRQDA